MTVHYGLTSMNVKNVVTGIFARLDFTAYVWIYKHNFPRICLTSAEYREVEKKKAEVSALLENAKQPGGKKIVVINETLRLRLDTSYVTDMIVIERLENQDETSSETNTKDITSVWLVAKSWQKLVHLMPTLSHTLQMQELWCNDIKELFELLGKYIKDHHSAELREVKCLDDFVNFLQNKFNAEVFAVKNDDLRQFSRNGMDVRRCLLELIALCPSNLLYQIRGGGEI